MTFLKLILYITIFMIFSTVIIACGSKESNREELTTSEITTNVQQINWNAHKNSMMRTIDKHFVDNTLRKGDLEYRFNDKVRKDLMVRFTLSNIEQDSLFPISDKAAFMKVNARSTKGDSLVFDYEVTVTPSKLKADSMVYEVRSLNLRKVNQEQRYILKKEGNFWTKEILAVAQ